MTENMTRSDNLRGSLWMIASMAGFAVEDAFVKAAAVQLPVGEVLMIFGLGGAIVFGCIACLRKERLFTRDVVSRSMRIRVVFEFVGRLFYVLALAMTPLSSTTAILQATPIIVVLGAAVFFGEKVGWQRWAAIVVGLLGVLVILRPSSESFSWLSLLAVIGMIGFAGRDLASRAAPLSLSTSILGLYGFLTIVLAGACYAVWEGRAIPEVLLSGNHAKVDAWRRAQSEAVTQERRPDLWRAFHAAKSGTAELDPAEEAEQSDAKHESRTRP